jgi:hypothetical protein
MAATYEPIATTTLGSATNTVTFSNLSQTYTDIVAVIVPKTASSTANCLARVNGDTGTNYSRTVLSGNGSTASSSRISNTSYLNFDNAAYLNTEFSPWIIHFMNYSNTTTFKTVLNRGNNAALGVDAAVNLWRSTSAITEISFLQTSGNYATGSTFTLYGIKAA